MCFQRVQEIPSFASILGQVRLHEYERFDLRRQGSDRLEAGRSVAPLRLWTTAARRPRAISAVRSVDPLSATMMS